MSQIFQQAAALHQSGRLAEAEALYRAILKTEPGNFDALNLLGVARAQQGDKTEAERLIALALTINGTSIPTLNNHGNALYDLERFEEALKSYDKAIALKPDYATAHQNRGKTLYALGRFEEAIASYDRALSYQTDYSAVFSNRALALRALGRNAEALATYDAALTIQPNDFNIFCNRGMLLHKMLRFDQALANYNRALTLKRDDAGILVLRGNVLHDLRHLEEALASYDRAIALKPTAEAFSSRGAVLKDLRRFDEALASFNAAIAVDPTQPYAFQNRAMLRENLKQLEDALTDYDATVRLDPDNGMAAGHAFLVAGELCDWSRRKERIANLISRSLANQSILPFAMLIAADNPEAQARAATSFAEKTFPPSGPHPWRLRARTQKLRIGYVSADFNNHATSYLAAELFERHDRNQFQIEAISLSASDESPMRQRLEAAFDHFHDVHTLSEEAIARLMAARELDVAVDMKGHTRGSRPGIFVLRPNPIAVSYLAYPGTMGMSCIDYIIADSHVIPDAQRNLYRESVVYLPYSYQVNDARRPLPDASLKRETEGLPEDGLVFCCFSNTHKLSPELFDVWMRLLKGVEGSILWLYADNESARSNLAAEAKNRGVPRERIVFASFERDLARHISRVSLADLFLDTLPYNGHTTASDALWAGVPVLTCSGQSFPARVAGSLLRAIGLPELVTNTLADYEELALKLARDRALLAKLRATLAKNRTTHPLFDAAKFTRHLETAYTVMCERHRNGLAPESFSVEASPP